MSSKGSSWHRGSSGLPVGRLKRHAALTDAIDFDYEPKPPSDVRSALWVTTSIAHATTGMVQGVASDSFNTSRTMHRLRGDKDSPLRAILNDHGEVVAEVADQGELKTWGEQDRQKRQENMRFGKKITDPTSGSAT
jgi:hypothetical protein